MIVEIRLAERGGFRLAERDGYFVDGPLWDGRFLRLPPAQRGLQGVSSLKKVGGYAKIKGETEATQGGRTSTGSAEPPGRCGHVGLRAGPGRGAADGGFCDVDRPRNDPIGV